LKIGIIGGGPAGLYFGILIKAAKPDAEVRVVEKNPEGVTWGWGVVFSAETMENFREADPPTHERITSGFARWDAIDVHHRGEMITSSGHGFAGIRRVQLLNLLTARARELGVQVDFDTTIGSWRDLDDCDLIVAADGVNSGVRAELADHIRPTTDMGTARFIWLGSDKKWDTFTFIIGENDDGVFQVHAYQFDAENSTFIVECDEQSWRNAGLDTATEAESIAYCEKLFAKQLDGAKLMGNRSRWLQFPTLRCETWFHDKVVLIGDSAHTAHFSIGSGTKLAMEDAIALCESLQGRATVPEALEAYHERRWLDVAKLQRAADVSRRWFENIKRYTDLDPATFAASLLSRSKRITHDNLRLRDRGYVESLDRAYAERVGHPAPNDGPVPPPMFQPFRLRGLELANRVVVSSMCMYSAEDGMPNDWHLVHLGSRAIGGVGLLMTEMTNVSAEARITPGCAGLWSEAQVAAWKRITDFVHANSRAKIGVQLGHAGRKGATQIPFGPGHNVPMDADAWPLLAPSAIPWSDGSATPKAMDRGDMDGVREQFVAATRHAEAAGFDLIELHAAHGYLLSTFISPLTNTRTDEYGGSVENRMRFPLEVFDAMREAWPEERPLTVRVSAADWADGGLTEEEAVEVARLFSAHGCDLIDVSTGGNVPEEDPIYGRMFQTPFSDRIRNEAGISTIAVGNIQGWDHVNTIVVTGRADLCALARPHLYDPYFTAHAAAEQGFEQGIEWPRPYRAAGAVATRIAERRRTAEDDGSEGPNGAR
jgi:anthraniloyl-CoA monooxygenase